MSNLSRPWDLKEIIYPAIAVELYQKLKSNAESGYDRTSLAVEAKKFLFQAGEHTRNIGRWEDKRDEALMKWVNAWNKTADQPYSGPKRTDDAVFKDQLELVRAHAKKQAQSVVSDGEIMDALEMFAAEPKPIPKKDTEVISEKIDKLNESIENLKKSKEELEAEEQEKRDKETPFETFARMEKEISERTTSAEDYRTQIAEVKKSLGL